MLAMRDALLWQLHKLRLRQEIIVAELAKIECAMALHAASGDRTMPMPRDGMPQHKEPVFGWEHYGDVVGENDVNLPNNNERQSPESRFRMSVEEDRANKCWNPCECGGNAGQQNSAFDEPKLQDSSEVSSLSILFSFHMSSILPLHTYIFYYFTRTRLAAAFIGPFLLL